MGQAFDGEALPGSYPLHAGSCEGIMNNGLTCLHFRFFWIYLHDSLGKCIVLVTELPVLYSKWYSADFNQLNKRAGAFETG